MKKFKSIVFILMLTMIFSLIPSKLADAGTDAIHIVRNNEIISEIGIGPGQDYIAKINLNKVNKKKNAVYSYYTSDKKIVEVNKSTGALKGIKAGKAIITCKETISGKTKVFGTCEVTVKDIIIEKGPFSIALDDEFNITYKTKYSNNEATYQYSSSKPSIATVSKDGVVKAKQVGTTKVTVKEVLKGKTRTVGTVTIQVKAATFAKRSYFTVESVFLLTSDEFIYPGKFLDHSISGAVYEFVSGDETIMKVEKRGSKTYLVPLKTGVTTLTVKETFKGKTRTVGTLYAAIELRRSLDVNKDYFNSEDTSYIRVTEGVEGSIESLLLIKDIKNFAVHKKDLDIKYTSNKEEIVEVDEKTGVFKANKPGVATITASVPGSKVMINVNVESKGAMGEVENTGYSIMENINSLVKTEITNSNASELWRKITNISPGISDYLDMYWGEREPYFFRVTGDRNYWAAPNYYKLNEFANRVVDVLKVETDELFAKQEIVSVSNIKKDSITVEFKYPITENIYTYYMATTSDSFWYEGMLYCHISNVSKEKHVYGTLQYKKDAKILELKLNSALEKGTHSLKSPFSSAPFEFTYK